MSRLTKIEYGVVVLGVLILVLTAYAAQMGFWEATFLIILTVFSVVLALWYADLGKPKFTIQALPPQNINIGDLETVFLQMSVANNPLSNRPFISRRTAFSCHGTIEVSNTDRKMLFKMPIRWSNNPQPIKPDLDRGKAATMLDQSLIRMGGYIDIPPDESEDLDICYRAPTTSEAVGWSTDSYRVQAGRYTHRILPLGDYQIRILIKHDHGAHACKLTLHNPQDIADFKLDMQQTRIPVNSPSNRN